MTCHKSAQALAGRCLPVMVFSLAFRGFRDIVSLETSKRLQGEFDCTSNRGTCKIRLSDEKAGQPEEFCAEEAAFFRVATGFGCYRMGEGTKLGVFEHAATEDGY